MSPKVAIELIGLDEKRECLNQENTLDSSRHFCCAFDDPIHQDATTNTEIISIGR